MAAVWVTLTSEAVVLLAVVSAAVTWVRQSPTETAEQELGQPATPLPEQPA
ncbi:hypothetical protein DFQ14_10421 [Halopolyspora algeriensis]|uniref:Uncharacterized protein n=1 Tax=Halopolyspora algeriensis TaxID=1500506 RepID=A0A368VR66_9ACTN|nr:hypothetical protein [Halopolyspora algeriensis]RCW44432.1 hypothetical protein DFQ14_10421 [Halopolyspora algeriensis]TQM55793.1 hypothetical protein FHU43_0569 [Halopolyspora algeriensis]